MGWCSGSYIAEDIYDKIRILLPEDKRKEIAEYIYNKFCEYDADDWCFSTLTEDADQVVLCPKCKKKYGKIVWKIIYVMNVIMKERKNNYEID